MDKNMKPNICWIAPGEMRNFWTSAFMKGLREE